MLTAVFELEANEGGMLGLFDNDPEATYWNGMSLAAYFKDKDYIDEDQSAVQLLRRLEPHIDKTSSEISIRFGYMYGRMWSFHEEYALADAWLTNTYYHGGKYLSKEKIAEYGVYLYDIRTFYDRQKKWEDLAKDVENQIKNLPEYQTASVYTLFLKFYCGIKFRLWQKGTPEPEELRETLIRYQESATTRYAQENNPYDNFQSVYFDMLYANRVENLDLGERAFEKMSQALEIFNKNPDMNVRVQQAVWIQYHEQLLYFALLMDNRERVLDTVEKLLNYPYRRGSIPLKKLSSIQEAYQEADHPDINKHLLWDDIWF